MFKELRVHRLFPLMTVLFIAVILVLTGPLIALPGDSPDHSRQQLAGGTANVSVVESPTKSVWLRKGDYSSGQLKLNVPDSTVKVSSVTGSPFLNYKIQITSLGYAKTSLTMLGPSSEGRHTLSIPPATLNAERVQNDTYEGELAIILRANETRILYQENITVYVER